MRRMSLLLALCFIPAILVMYGCGPRAEVAKKKILDKIDDALGKMDVQKAEIDAGIKSAKQALQGVRKAKIKAQGSADQLDDKVRPFQDKIDRCDESLARLRDAIKANKPADFAGKTYTVAQLNEMAGKVIQARKEAEAQIKGFDKARANMRKVVATITKQQRELETRIAKLQAANSKLDAEMAAAKAMKQASATMGDANSSLSDNLDELEKKIATLSADVQVDLAGESEKWSDAKTDKAISDVDAFIQATQRPADTVAEIDKILGPAKK